MTPVIVVTAVILCLFLIFLRRKFSADKHLTVAEILDINRSTDPAIDREQLEADPTLTPYLDEIIRRAEASGKTIEEVLLEDCPDNSVRQTPECLYDMEISIILNGGTLPEIRLQHYRDCSWCTTKVAVRRPVSEEGGSI